MLLSIRLLVRSFVQQIGTENLPWGQNSGVEHQGHSHIVIYGTPVHRLRTEPPDTEAVPGIALPMQKGVRYSFSPEAQSQVGE